VPSASTAWALSSRRRFWPGRVAGNPPPGRLVGVLPREGSCCGGVCFPRPASRAVFCCGGSHAHLHLRTCTSRSRALGADALTCSAVFRCAPLARAGTGAHAVLSSVPRVLWPWRRRQRVPLPSGVERAFPEELSKMWGNVTSYEPI
jgi:hypothetical protein